jgi:CRISPR/Cas system Type II protein with McrA/HNH and RuvC-like nuclease domain
MCQYHAVDASVRDFSSNKEVREKLINHLVDLYITQAGLCAYTNQKLEPGKSASIEHIYPKTTHPELALEPSNLVWITSMANTAKLNAEPDDPALADLLAPAVVARIRALASKVVRSG